MDFTRRVILVFFIGFTAVACTGEGKDSPKLKVQPIGNWLWSDGSSIDWLR